MTEDKKNVRLRKSKEKAKKERNEKRKEKQKAKLAAEDDSKSAAPVVSCETSYSVAMDSLKTNFSSETKSCGFLLTSLFDDNACDIERVNKQPANDKRFALSSMFGATHKQEEVTQEVPTPHIEADGWFPDPNQ